jgi:hypothetical protein
MSRCNRCCYKFVNNSLVIHTNLGKHKILSFLNDRLNSNKLSFWDTFPNTKLVTTAEMQVKTRDMKVVSISADRDLFGLLAIAAKARDVSLKDVHSYELAAVPFCYIPCGWHNEKHNKSCFVIRTGKIWGHLTRTVHSYLQKRNVYSNGTSC